MRMIASGNLSDVAALIETSIKRAFGRLFWCSFSLVGEKLQRPRAGGHPGLIRQKPCEAPFWSPNFFGCYKARSPFGDDFAQLEPS